MCVIYSGLTSVLFNRTKELLVPIVAFLKEENQVLDRREVQIVDDSVLIYVQYEVCNSWGE